VSWHIDDTDPPRLREVNISETEVDGHPSAFLFLEAVTVDTGEGLDERGLAVVDVTCRADNDASQGNPAREERNQTGAEVEAEDEAEAQTLVPCNPSNGLDDLLPLARQDGSHVQQDLVFSDSADDGGIVEPEEPGELVGAEAAVGEGDQCRGQLAARERATSDPGETRLNLYRKTGRKR
jgi:hypothetical protein